MKDYIALTTLVLVLLAISVYGHPGRTNDSGCHYCKTNCEQYGLSRYQYHCHNETEQSTSSIVEESSSSIESSSTSSSTTTSKKTTSSVKKTSSTSVAAEKITGSAIALVDNIEKNEIENDIYPSENGKIILYESSEKKAARYAVYIFSFMLVMIVISLLIERRTK